MDTLGGSVGGGCEEAAAVSVVAFGAAGVVAGWSLGAPSFGGEFADGILCLACM